MGTVLLDAYFDQSPEAVAAGEPAAWLYVKAACWCSRSRSPFFIPTDAARSLVDGKRGRFDRLAGRLVAVELWEEREGGYFFWQYVDFAFIRTHIPRAVRQAVFDRDGRACVECGATDDLTIDHIWPVFHGGLNTVENLRVLCRPCNSRKGAKV